MVDSKMNEFGSCVLVIGPTGIGKSSLINTINDANVAREGAGAKSETEGILAYPTKFNNQNFTFVDSQGCGDSAGSKKDEDFK